MPTETHNFNYITNASSVIVTATMKDADGNIIDTSEDTVVLPDPPEEGLILGGGTNNVARVPEEVQNGSKHTMYYVSDWVLGAVEDIDTFNSFTDAELLQKVDNHLNSIQSGTSNAGNAPAIPRSDYLNESTTGWIHLDIEEYINLNFVGDINPPEEIVYSEPRLENWAIGVMRRIDAFKIRCPNAKFSLWGFGSPQRAAHTIINGVNQFQRTKDKMLFVSNVSHNGKTLFDYMDFLSPVLYQKSDTGSSFEQRIENGERARQCIEIVTALFNLHGETKPVVPTFAFEYEGGPLANTNADRLNAIEMNILKDMPGFSHFQMWHAFYNEMFSPGGTDLFAAKRDRLIQAINELGNPSLPEDGILLPDGDLRGWDFMTGYLNEMNAKIAPEYDTGLGHHTNLTGSLMLFNDAGNTEWTGDQRVVSGDAAGVAGGPTINFADKNQLSVLQGLDLGQFDAYCAELTQRIKDQITTSVDADTTGKMKSGEYIIAIDPEIVLFDARWEKELGYLCTVNSIIDQLGSFPDPVDLTITNFSGLYVEVDPTDPEGRLVKNQRFEIVKLHLLDILDHLRMKLTHSKCYWYNLPMTIFQNNLWKIAANDQFNRPDLIEPIYQYAANDPDVQQFMEKALLYGLSWYPANFAHRKDVYDAMVEGVGAAFGDRSTMMTWPWMLRPVPFDGYIDGQNLFAGWSSFSAANHDPYLIDGDLSFTTNQLFPITRGMWKYMVDKAIASNVTPVLFPDFNTGQNLNTNDGVLVGDVVNTLNQTVGPQIGHTFGSGIGDDFAYWNFYFNNLLRDVMSEPIDLVDPTFTPDRRPVYLSNFGSNQNYEDFGVAFNTWRKTPVTGDTDGHNNSSFNGRKKYIENGGILSSYEDGFERLIIAQAGGWTNFGNVWEINNGIGELSEKAVKGYNVNAYSCMEFEHAPNYENVTWTDSDGNIIEALGNGDGTQLSDFGNPNDNPEFWLPSPFTTDGEVTGEFGDAREAWKAALDFFWGQVTNPEDVQLYHQWDWRPMYASLDGPPDDPDDTPVDLAGGFDRRSMGIDLHPTIGATRCPVVTELNTDFWNPEILGMALLGFNALTWGISGRAWQEGGNNDSLYTAVEQAYPGFPYLFEATPVVSIGTGEDKIYVPHGVSTFDTTAPFDRSLTGAPDERYERNGHWGFFPSYYTNDSWNDTGRKNGGRNIKHIAWNPQTTEHHIIFDYGTLVRQDPPPNLESWQPSDLKAAMAEAWQNGFVVGISELLNSGGTTRAENEAIRAFVLALNTITSSDGTTETSAATLDDGSAITRPVNPAAELYSATGPAPEEPEPGTDPGPLPGGGGR